MQPIDLNGRDAAKVSKRSIFAIVAGGVICTLQYDGISHNLPAYLVMLGLGLLSAIVLVRFQRAGDGQGRVWEGLYRALLVGGLAAGAALIAALPGQPAAGMLAGAAYGLGAMLLTFGIAQAMAERE